MRDRPFEVKPVRSYGVAKYPSDEDPDPCSYPAPVPFPFSRAFISALTGFGIAAGGAVLAAEDSKDATASKSPESPNPFAVKYSGLPHRTSPYGTGQPCYVQEDLARKVIERVFREEGIRLVKNQRLRDEEVEFVTDGYDSLTGIGYVFADASNLDDDAYISWMARSPTEQSAKALRTALRLEKHRAEKHLAKEIDAALALEDDAAFLTACKRVRHLLKRSKLSLSEAKKLEERAEEGEQFVAVISRFDRRYATSCLPSALQRQKLKAIVEISDEKERAAALNKFREAAARDSLERLERHVKEYIRWARSQGM